MIRTLPLALLLLAIAPWPAAIRAQVATRLPELQVTATRVPARTTDVPAAVTILEGDDLRERGITYLLDALRLVPSAAVVQTGSYGAVTSLFLRGGESDYTKVLVDGVVMNEPGGLINLAAFSLDDVDRIEVVRGPGSVLYGADAMSGVVQVFTRQGSGPAHGTVQASAGSFGGRDLRGHLAGSSGALSASLAGSRFLSDGIYAFNSGFADANGSAAVAWRGRSGTRVAGTARYGDATAHFPTDGNGDPVDADKRTVMRNLSLGLQLSQPLAHALDLSIEGWAHRRDSRFRDGRDGPADTVGFGFAGTRDALLTRRGLNLRTDWRALSTLTAIAGVAIERESEDQSSVTESDFGFGASTDSATFVADRQTRSAFVQLLAAPMRALNLQMGGRIDDNSAFGTFATVRVGAVVHLAAAARAWGSLGTGFKAPTFSELLAASPYEVGNPALRPEQSRNAEVGIEIGRRSTRLGLTIFAQHFSSFVQYISAAPGEPTYANLGAARARGIEAAVGVIAIPGISIDAQVTWIATEVTDTGAVSSGTFALGQSLLRRPAVSGALTVRGSQGGLAWTATGRWVGARDDVNFRDFPATRTRLPSYGLIDASIAVPVPLGVLADAEFLLRGENLLDAEWDAAIGYPGRGRTLFGGGRFTF